MRASWVFLFGRSGITLQNVHFDNTSKTKSANPPLKPNPGIGVADGGASVSTVGLGVGAGTGADVAGSGAEVADTGASVGADTGVTVPPAATSAARHQSVGYWHKIVG